WNLTLAAGAALTLSGLVVSGQPIEVITQQPAGAAADHQLALIDCTLVPGLQLAETGAPLSPGAASLRVDPRSAGPLQLTVGHAIVGRLDLRATPTTLTVTDSIVDGCGGGDPVIWGAGDARIERATLLGKLTARSIEASDVIFGGVAVVERTQIGCVRFSFVAK